MSLPGRRLTSALLTTAFVAFSGVYIYRNFRWSEVTEILLRANLLLFLLGGTLTILAYLVVRAWRWHCILASNGFVISFHDLYVASAAMIAMSSVTPLQGGEALKVEILRVRSDLGRLPGYTSFMVERSLDFVVLIALAIMTLPIPATMSLDAGILWVVAAAVLAVIVFGTITYRVTALHDVMQRALWQFRRYLRSPGKLSGWIVLTVIAWLIVAAGWAVFIRSVGIPLSFEATVALTCSVTLINVLSMVPGAVGVSEVGVTEFLRLHDIGVAEAQAGALMIRLYGVLLLGLGAIHLGYWRYRLAQGATSLPRGGNEGSRDPAYQSKLPPLRARIGSSDRPLGDRYRSRRHFLAAYLGMANVCLTPSGRGALYFLLKTQDRTKVVVPAYTCSAVVQAAQLAGKEVRFVDAETDSFNVDVDALRQAVDEDSISLPRTSSASRATSRR